LNENENGTAVGRDKIELKPADDKEEENEKEKQNYFCNFFQHFAIPIFVYIILYSVILNRGWKFAYPSDL